MMKLKKLARLVRLKKWIQRICFLYFTLPAQLENQKAWCILVGDIWSTPAIHFRQRFSIVMVRCIGVPQTLGGLRDILIFFMPRSLLAQQLLFSRVFPHGPIWEDSGRR